MATKITFTKRTLEAIEPPTDQDRVYVYDKRTPGLALCVTRGGGRTFYVYRRIHGRPVRVRLGRFPEMTIEQARKRTTAVLAEIADGGDPQARKRAVRAECRLIELFDHFMATHAKVHKSESSWREDQRMFDRYLSAWLARRISTITTAEITRLHAAIGKKHPYQANRVLAMLSKVFNYGRRTLSLKVQNPCEGVTRFPEQQRERYLDGAELGAFFQALADEEEPFRSFFLILLLTGARRGNVQSMAWADIDLERGLWRIAHTESKSGRSMLIVLAPEVVACLRGLQADGAEYVFPSTGKTGT